MRQRKEMGGTGAKGAVEQGASPARLPVPPFVAPSCSEVVSVFSVVFSVVFGVFSLFSVVFSGVFSVCSFECLMGGIVNSM